MTKDELYDYIYELFVDRRNKATVRYHMSDLHNYYRVDRGTHIVMSKEDYDKVISLSVSLGEVLGKLAPEKASWPSCFTKGDIQALNILWEGVMSGDKET